MVARGEFSRFRRVEISQRDKKRENYIRRARSVARLMAAFDTTVDCAPIRIFWRFDRGNIPNILRGKRVRTAAIRI